MRISDWSSDVCSSDLCQWLRCPQSSDVRPGCNCYFIAYLPSILTRCCAPLSLSVIIFRHFPHVASSRNIVAHDHEQVVIILRPTILLLLTLLYLIDIIAYSLGRGLPVGVPLFFPLLWGGVWTSAGSEGVRVGKEGLSTVNLGGSP